MRTFIALALPDDARQTLARYQAALREAVGEAVRWTSTDQLHFTVRFLGEIEQAMIEPVLAVMRETAADTPPITAQCLARVGAFPNLQAPQMLWVGVGRGAEAITPLAHRIAQGVVALGCQPASRVFHAHITLGRVKMPAQARRIGRILETITTRADEAPYHLDRLVLMDSVLTPQGPVHTLIGEVPLSGRR